MVLTLVISFIAYILPAPQGEGLGVGSVISFNLNTSAENSEY